MNRLILLLLFFTGTACAAGPEKIATLDRTSWPEKVASAKAFDRASRFEIYLFLRELKQVAFSDEEAVRTFTGVSRANIDSVKRWKALTEARLLAGFLASCDTLDEKERESCRSVAAIADIEAVMLPRYQSLGGEYEQWKTHSSAFHRRYLYEQVRLAALFPRITSEILLLSADELSGYEMEDKHFLLTYDDGPSNGETTELLVDTLEQRDSNALFFVLGDQFAAASAERVARLYDDQCIGSHGYVHKPHPKYPSWKSSIDKSYALIERKLGKSTDGMWFRPPYGQRSDEINGYLMANHHARAMLWNIDSQDWNGKVNAQEVTDRVVTLMLLWRKGVVLFHDLYTKSARATGELLQFAAANGAAFIDCHRLSEKAPARR